jgi:CO/xanthine dehydrogenase FAD-binding subunit
MGAYLRPGALEAAVAALAQRNEPGARPWVVVAGATDHYPARVGRQPDEDILDVTAISGLRGIEAVHDGGSGGRAGWRIGALTTWTDLVETPLPPLFDGLKAAALAIGGLQIQARATIAGNVCNASPAADGVPNLLAMDAEVELASSRGVRRVPIGAFVVGNRRTVREPDELITGIVVPAPMDGSVVRSTCAKLGSRAYLVISIAMVAAIVELDAGGRIARARVAVGACSEVAQRLRGLEADLQGRAASEVAGAVAASVRAEHLAALRPIDDVRGTAAYRSEAALELVRRALADVLA